MKYFVFAGFSTCKRRTRVRYANTSGRVKTLERNEHTDINMFSLPKPMSKLEAVEWLIAGHFDGGDVAIAEIFADELARLQKAEGIEAAEAAEAVEEAAEEAAEEVEEDEEDDETAEEDEEVEDAVVEEFEEDEAVA